MITPADYFARTFVINLVERPDRLEQVTAALARIRMTWTPDKVELFQTVKPKHAAGFQSPGQHGCFQSHLAVLRRAHELKLPNVLVFEDDVEFVNVFPRVWVGIPEQLTRHAWSIAYFGYRSAHRDRFADRTTPHIEMQPFTRQLDCLHAYAVNGPALAAVVEHFEQILLRPPGDPRGGPMSPDAAMNVFREQHPEMLTLIAEPQLAYQRASDSDAHSKAWQKNRTVRLMLSPLRRVKNKLRQSRI